MSVHTYRWIPLAHAPKQENASSKCSLYSYPTLWSTHEAYNWYFECPWIAPVWNLCQELQSCKDQIKHLKDTLQQRSGSVEVQKMQKELEDLTQEHQQTKAMLVESEKRKSDIQSEIARVQSAKTFLEDELSKLTLAQWCRPFFHCIFYCSFFLNFLSLFSDWPKMIQRPGKNGQSWHPRWFGAVGCWFRRGVIACHEWCHVVVHAVDMLHLMTAFTNSTLQCCFKQVLWLYILFYDSPHGTCISCKHGSTWTGMSKSVFFAMKSLQQQATKSDSTRVWHYHGLDCSDDFGDKHDMLFPLNVTGGTDPRWNSVFYVCQEVSTLQKIMFQKDRGTLDATEGVVKQQNGRKSMGLIFGFEIHESTRGFMHGLTPVVGLSYMRKLEIKGSRRSNNFTSWV